MRKLTEDRFGIGWRPELAAGILAHLDRIDLVEVIAEDYFDAPSAKRRSLRTLASQVPVALHGVSLGMASSIPVDETRLDKLARLVSEIRPAFWSEHLAFVRAGGVEIGHLAMPPRTRAVVEGTLRNVEKAVKTAGTPPLLENIASLLEPPVTEMSEAEWIAEILRGSGCGLLLDLHNLHANATNFGFDAVGFLDRIPSERVAAIHLSGGRWIGSEPGARRLLDDHLHDVPDPVYELLKEAGRRAENPLTVILERDGNYPGIEDMLSQLEKARVALAEGRSERMAAA